MGGAMLLLAVSIGSFAGQASPAAAAPPPTDPADPAAAVVPPSAPPNPFVQATDAHNPSCAIEIQPGDSLSSIADRIPDTAVSFEDLQSENALADADYVQAGDLLDICVGNQVDDVVGGSRTAGPSGGEVENEAVAAQQRKLNELFAGYGIRELLVDGISGPITRRQLCAARVAFGLPVSRADMAPGSAEEQFLMSAAALPVQPSSSTDDKWIVIDKTCQIMFAGNGSEIVYVFPTSTGEEGYETRNQENVRAFRYNPATDNAGWHDSTTFPAAEDNPLNGNMYKPIYFYNGQAIHGSYNVPPEPLSKGCARLNVEDQDKLVAWLGLGDATSPVWSAELIDLRVSVQGDF